MPKAQYGNTTIYYSLEEAPGLKRHYLSVDNKRGVVLKGKNIGEIESAKLIVQKGKWITEKLEVVNINKQDLIVTGSRMPYLGKTFYVEVVYSESVVKPILTFTYAKFLIYIHPEGDVQADILKAFDEFFKIKAREKILPRLSVLCRRTLLIYETVQFRKMTSRWGSCSHKNNLTINFDIVKLPFALIDYILIHELCHTKVKNHSNVFWREVRKYLPDYKALDHKLSNWKFL
ncbi:M48 family metallopeptidase [Chitinophaga sp. HK235]|uniref:M48 family metallopeptidase n=1 Tax=Chitinophaga sp. HK235 TaxID=2952571 RepID=UPI001BA77D4D|nr:SprT family zinc-dependent metalloprotease [Chitinophaga sp. HK235]